jgi:hypothetical protein
MSEAKTNDRDGKKPTAQPPLSIGGHSAALSPVDISDSVEPLAAARCRRQTPANGEHLANAIPSPPFPDDASVDLPW